ncbi:MAG: hypothetical protein M1365_10155, partial [Actinobacteria bacterium]|nr:hypothetical protein [Actinomycetota bacterium]
VKWRGIKMLKRNLKIGFMTIGAPDHIKLKDSKFGINYYNNQLIFKVKKCPERRLKANII